VNDAGAQRVIPAFNAPVQECVHERARRVASAWVHHEPCRFVHYQDVLILEDDGYGDLFGGEIVLGDMRFYGLSAADPVGRRDFAAIDEQEILLDESPHEATADPEPPGGKPVDALPGFCRVYSEVLYGAPTLLRTTKPLLTPVQKAADAAVWLRRLPIEELLRVALFGKRRLLPLYFACRLGTGGS